MNLTKHPALLAATLALLLPAPLVVAGGDPVDWADPAAIPWIPAPVVVRAMTPTAEEETCTGTSEVRVHGIPQGASVAVRLESKACAIVAGDVEWTVGGRTYAAPLDPSTLALGRIRILAGEAAPEAPAVPLSDAPDAERILEDDDLIGQFVDAGDLAGWYGFYDDTREGHAWNHLWSRGGGGDEDVKVNYGWHYNGPKHYTLAANARCTTTGDFRVDSCEHCVHGNGCQDGTRGASGHGHFHEHSWGRVTNQHYLGARVFVQSDQTSTGACYEGGDMPWWYGVECKYGPGVV